VLGRITPCSNKSCTCFFTSLYWSMDCLCNIVFGNGLYGSNYIMFNIPLRR
jgi:hypothetical protein